MRANYRYAWPRSCSRAGGNTSHSRACRLPRSLSLPLSPSRARLHRWHSMEADLSRTKVVLFRFLEPLHLVGGGSGAGVGVCVYIDI